MFEAWFLTVFSEISRSLAISLLLLPCERAFITSSSLSVRLGVISALVERMPSKVVSVFLAMSGDMMVSPAWTARMAPVRSSGVQSLRM
jgi:hypothetical protein